MSSKQNFIGWTPVKLALEDGNWSLEVQRLVALSKTLYRPQHGRIHGREPILEELRDRESLAADAEAVFARVKEDGVFELRGGRFRPVDPNEKPLDVATYDAEVEARVKSLEGEVKRLEARIAKLVQLGVRSSAAPANPADAATNEGPAAVGSESGAPDSDQPEANAEDRQRQGDDPSAEASDAAEPGTDAEAATSDADGADDASPEASEGTEPKPEGEAAATDGDEANADEPAPEAHPADANLGPPIKLPSLEEFSAVFDELVGGEVTLSLAGDDGDTGKKGKKGKKRTTEAKGPKPKLELAATSYVTCLLTDEDVVVGAIACSEEAVAYEGGGLLMLGPDVIDNMLQNGVTEEAVEAAQEIFNVASRAFNEVSGNPHIRVTTLKVFEPDGEHEWTPRARDYTELVDSKGGRVWLISR